MLSHRVLVPRLVLCVIAVILAAGAFAQTIDVTVTKNDSPDPVVAGSNLTYTLTLTNNEPNPATSMTLSDATPANTTFVSAMQTAGPAFTLTTPPVGGTGTFSATIGSFAAGATATFTLVVNVNPDTPQGATITNTATATFILEGFAGDTSDTEATSVLAQADLSVTKTDSPDPVAAGSNLTYTLTIANIGPSDAQSVTLTDAVPANTTFVSFLQNSGPAFTLVTPPAGGTGNVTATAATLAAGATATFTLIVNVDAGTPHLLLISNTATIASTTTDGSPSNNSDIEMTSVTGAPDLVVTKTDSPDPVVAGNNLTYTLTLTNSGQSAAQNVSLSDAIPANTTFVSAMQTAGPAFTLTTPPVGGTGTFTATIASFAASATATFTLVVNVNANTPQGATITNTATASATTGDLTPADNTDAEVTSVLAQADLSVTKTDSPDPVVASANLTYTLTIANVGPSDAQSVTLSDSVPVNTTFVSFLQNSGPAFTLFTPPAGGTGTVTATAATLAAGATATFTLVVNVDAVTPGGSTIANTATIAATTVEPNPANNSDLETTTVAGGADLSVAKSGTEVAPPGTNIVYTLTLANNGTNAALNASLSDAIPANTTFISFMQTSGPAFTLTTPPAGGTGTVTATIASFAPAATATFQLVVNVNASTAGGTTITNTATVVSVTNDVNPADNTDSAVTTIPADPIPTLSEWMLLALAGALAAVAALKLRP